ncbi:MAG: peroxiredoxin [Planctomycetota bacterium]|jgi:peroxiredoxin
MHLYCLRCNCGSQTIPNPTSDMIDTGAQAPEFELDSHLDSKVKLSSFKGEKNVLLVFYPLDFTPT